MRFYYLGWDFQGFATQEDTTETIEFHIFKALTTTCLIEDRETANYNRCGRTDKGVSAYFQVISLDIRSGLSKEQILNNEDTNKEIQYCSLLNRVLPPQIRCIAWMPVNNPLYSARFDCRQRTYKYYFPKGNLDLQVMSLAAQRLVGTHDFRNFCKMDVNSGVTNFERNISKIQIFLVRKEDSSQREYSLYCCKIESQAFIWHQIRCIMAILFLVGQKFEEPEIIDQLLDIESNPRYKNLYKTSKLFLIWKKNLFPANQITKLPATFRSIYFLPNSRKSQEVYRKVKVNATWMTGYTSNQT